MPLLNMVPLEAQNYGIPVEPAVTRKDCKVDWKPHATKVQPLASMYKACMTLTQMSSPNSHKDRGNQSDHVIINPFTPHCQAIPRLNIREWIFIDASFR